MAKVQKKATTTRKRRERKNIAAGQVHIQASFNNTTNSRVQLIFLT